MRKAMGWVVATTPAWAGIIAIVWKEGLGIVALAGLAVLGVALCVGFFWLGLKIAGEI